MRLDYIGLGCILVLSLSSPLLNKTNTYIEHGPQPHTILLFEVSSYLIQTTHTCEKTNDTKWAEKKVRMKGPITISSLVEIERNNGIKQKLLSVIQISETGMSMRYETSLKSFSHTSNGNQQKLLSSHLQIRQQKISKKKSHRKHSNSVSVLFLMGRAWICWD
jgi:hypothetical protein